MKLILKFDIGLFEIIELKIEMTASYNFIKISVKELGLMIKSVMTDLFTEFD